MFIAFEGQDAAGKSALLRQVHDELQRAGVPVTALPEFSDSPYGEQLAAALARDPFLRPVTGDPATAYTRALEEIADLYYFDARVIGLALDAGQVVLKDRHLDTALSALTVLLAPSGEPLVECRALRWLQGTLSELRFRPTVTVYVEAPAAVRRERLRDRSAADAGSIDDGLAVCAARERIVRQLMVLDPTRFLTVHNDGSQPISTLAAAVLPLIRSWRLRQTTERTCP